MRGPCVTAGVKLSHERSAWLDPAPCCLAHSLLPPHSEEAVHMQKTNGIKGRQLIFSAGGCDGIWVLRLWRMLLIPFFSSVKYLHSSRRWCPSEFHHWHFLSLGPRGRVLIIIWNESEVTLHAISALSTIPRGYSAVKTAGDSSLVSWGREQVGPSMAQGLVPTNQQPLWCGVAQPAWLSSDAGKEQRTCWEKKRSSLSKNGPRWGLSTWQMGRGKGDTLEGEKKSWRELGRIRKSYLAYFHRGSVM